MSVADVGEATAPETEDASGSGDEDQPERIEIVLRGSDPDGSVAAFRVGPLPPGRCTCTDRRRAGAADRRHHGHPAVGNERRRLLRRRTPTATAPCKLRLSAIDDAGLEDPTPATVTIEVAQVNDAPIAHDLTIEVDEDQPLDYPPAHLFNVVDIDGDVTAAALVSGPAHAGSFLLRPDGSFRYVPAADFNGADAFTYRASDGNGGFDEGTVTIVVRPVDEPGIDWTGTGGGDVFAGTDQGDTLSGLGGNDALQGRGGNDTILAGTGNDAIGGGDGNDTISGEDGNDAIDGGNGNDSISGGKGNDAVLGGFGDDVIDGGADNDVLTGGYGSDTIIGGLGGDLIILIESGQPSRDTVRYTSVDESLPSNRDTIVAFDRGGETSDDRIDLSAIDARPGVSGDQPFSFVPTFTAAPGEVRVSRSGSDTLVSVDTDSDPAAEMTILVLGATTLTAEDFIL